MANGDAIELRVARALAAAASVEDARRAALYEVGDFLGWSFVALWEPVHREDEIACVASWAAPQAEPFRTLSAELRLPSGTGLPGAVWERGDGVWIDDASEQIRLPRREAAAEAGLFVAFAVPVRSERGIVGVLECFGPEVRPRDDELVASMEVVGLLLGQLAERTRAEAERFALLQRHRATLEATLDPIVAMDHEGRVLEFNPAAERVFGYRRDEAIGRDMGELIVPPELREAHRAGLERYLRTNEARVLDQRVELEAVCADGRRIPVELTITRIAVDGPPVFTGQLRDITDRRRQEAELKASRARIVEAGDAARRKIERDLHDGAQQQLVGIAVSLRSAKTRLEKGDLESVAEILDESATDLSEALANLRELARGIHPAVLTDGGLGPALRGLARRSPVPVELVAVPDQRCAPAPEAAVYFVAAEGLTNAARYADATLVEVEVELADGLLSVEVRDDGRGGADPSGSGLRGLADRLAALDGRLVVSSAEGKGTIVRAEVPCGS
jgi:PAS domain S-box-containing protein